MGLASAVAKAEVINISRFSHKGPVSDMMVGISAKFPSTKSFTVQSNGTLWQAEEVIDPFGGFIRQPQLIYCKLWALQKIRKLFTVLIIHLLALYST